MKTLWQNEELLNMINFFSLYHNVINSHLLQKRRHASVWVKLLIAPRQHYYIPLSFCYHQNVFSIIC